MCSTSEPLDFIIRLSQIIFWCILRYLTMMHCCRHFYILKTLIDCFWYILRYLFIHCFWCILRYHIPLQISYCFWHILRYLTLMEIVFCILDLLQITSDAICKGPSLNENPGFFHSKESQLTCLVESRANSQTGNFENLSF